MRTSRVPACLVGLLFFVIPGLCGGLPEEPPRARTLDHSAFDAILGDVVRGEAVDYARIRARHTEVLERYLARVAAFDLSTLTERERLAAYINLYNGRVLREVTARFRPGYSVSDASFALFDEPLVELGGKRISLNQLEHEIIRPSFAEPRVHVALVCAARSCPPLLPRAYRADDLEAMLETGMQRFVNDPARNTIDPERRELRLSSLFDWYADDFGGAERIADYIDRYTKREVAGFAVSFREYSWELNVVPGARP